MNGRRGEGIVAQHQKPPGLVRRETDIDLAGAVGGRRQFPSEKIVCGHDLAFGKVSSGRQIGTGRVQAKDRVWWSRCLSHGNSGPPVYGPKYSSKRRDRWASPV